VIFTKVFRNPAPDFHVYLMAGLLAFSAFNSAVAGASTSVVGNAGLVKKVRFPLLVLPLSGRRLRDGAAGPAAAGAAGHRAGQRCQLLRPAAAADRARAGPARGLRDRARRADGGAERPLPRHQPLRRAVDADLVLAEPDPLPGGLVKEALARNG
jgi:hypothetical protein